MPAAPKKYGRYLGMSTEHGKPLVLSLTSAALLTLSQGAIGCALGILFSEKLGKKSRTLAGLGFLSLALLTTVPALVGVLVDLINGPSSKLGVRRRLRSIREGSGLQEEEVF
jgi:ABC-type molybdate transport system permease subunit